MWFLPFLSFPMTESNHFLPQWRGGKISSCLLTLDSLPTYMAVNEMKLTSRPYRSGKWFLLHKSPGSVYSYFHQQKYQYVCVQVIWPVQFVPNTLDRRCQYWILSKFPKFLFIAKNKQHLVSPRESTVTVILVFSFIAHESQTTLLGHCFGFVFFS